MKKIQAFKYIYENLPTFSQVYFQANSENNQSNVNSHKYDISGKTLCVLIF